MQNKTNNVDDDFRLNKVIDRLNNTELFIIVFLTVFFTVLFVFVVVVMSLKKYRKKSTGLCVKFNTNSQSDSKDCKSAPISRRTSSKSNRRKSTIKRSRSYGSLTSQLKHNYCESNQQTFNLTPLSQFKRASFINNSSQSSSAESIKHNLVDVLTINHETQQQKSSSESSDEELDGTIPNTKFAQLWYSIFYDYDFEILTVKVIKARNLPARDNDSVKLRDSFVKIFILPDEQLLNQTKIVRRSLNPKFFEVFHMHIPPNEIGSKFIRFTIYDINKKKVRYTVGHVIVGPLKGIDLKDSITITCQRLLSTIEEINNFGEVYLSLYYNPTISQIRISIIRSRNLNLFRLDTSNYNIFVSFRISSYIDNKLDQLICTEPKLLLSNQEFDENIDIRCKNENLDTTSVILSLILHYENNADREFGRIVFGYQNYLNNEDDTHWMGALNSPYKTISRFQKILMPKT